MHRPRPRPAPRLGADPPAAGLEVEVLDEAALEALGRSAEVARTLEPAARVLSRISPEAVRLAHPFAEAERTEALLAPLARVAAAETA